jgi:hypothetical protein
MRRQTLAQDAKDVQTGVWLDEVLPHWDAMRRSATVEGLLAKGGIPLAIRGQIWAMAIGISTFIYCISSFLPSGNSLGINLTEQGFQQLCQEADQSRRDLTRRENEDSTCHAMGDTQQRQSPFRLIEVDVPRTFFSTELFLKHGPYYNHLTTVLALFATHTPEIGYVQGMSYLAGMLLFYCDAMTTYICFSNLINNDFFISLFKMDVDRILAHIKVFDLLFHFNLPQTAKRFGELGISHEQYLLDWFMTMFSKALSIEIASRVWDNYLIYGEVFLFRVALGMLLIRVLV